MVAFGVSYLFWFYQTLLTPGTGVDITYEGRDGDVRLTTKTLAIDPVRRQVIVTDARLYTPSGLESVFVEKLTAGLKPSGGIAIAISKGHGTLIRDEDGLSVLQLLPPKKDKPGPSISLSIDSFDLNYKDLTGSIPLRRTLKINDFEYGSGDKASLMKGSVHIPNAGLARISAQTDVETLRVNIQTDRLDLQEIRPEIERWLGEESIAKLAPYRAENLIVAGDGSFFKIKKQLHWNGEFHYAADQLAAGKGGIWSHAEGQVRIQDNLLMGQINGTGRGKNIAFDGGVRFGKQFRILGHLVAQVASGQSLGDQLKKYLPKYLRFDGANFDGQLAFQGDQGLELDGEVQARSIAFQKFVGRSVNGQVRINDQDLFVELDRALYEQEPVEGWFAIKGQKRMLSGNLVSQQADLGKVIRELGVKGIALVGRTEAILNGTLKEPKAVLDFKGSGSYQIPKRGLLVLDTIQARIDYADGKFVINRGMGLGDSGSFTATGQYDLKQEHADLEVSAAGADLGLLDERLEGVAFVEGVLAGNLEDITFVGNAKALDVQFEDRQVPVIQSLVTYVDDRLELSQLEAILGIGKVTGALSINMDSSQLRGSLQANDLFISDFYEADIIGRVDLESVNITGTIDDPQALVAVRGSNILAYGQNIESLDAIASINKEAAELQQMELYTIGGRATAKGLYNFSTKTGMLTGELIEIDLSQVSLDASNVLLKGEVSGPFNVVLSESGNQGSWDGQIDFLAVNGFELGSGVATLAMEGDQVTGDLAIGSTAGFLEVKAGKYNLKTKVFNGKILANTIGVDETILALDKSFDFKNATLENFLSNLVGTYNADITVSGTPGDFDVTLNSLNLLDLSASGRPLGEIELEGTFADDSWRLETFHWVNGEAVVDATGSGIVDGPVDLQGSVLNFDPYLISLFAQDMPEVHAKATAYWQLSGELDKLSGQTSLQLSDIVYRDGSGQAVAIPVSINTEGLTLSNGVVDVNATLGYLGIEADLTGTLPIKAFQEDPQTSAQFMLEVKEHELSVFQEHLPMVDWERTKGTFGGHVNMLVNSKEATIVGDLALGGNDQAGAILAFDRAETSLNSVTTDVSIKDGLVTLRADGQSSQGGSISVMGTAQVGDMLNGNFSEFSLNEVPISLKAQFDQFAINEQIVLLESKGKNVVEHKATAPSSAILNGSVQVSGQAFEPVISGNVIASKVAVNLPRSFPPSQPSEPSDFNPRFEDLVIQFDQESHLRMLIAELEFYGQTSIAGSLNNLQLRAPLTVTDGKLNLPATRINIEDGGEVTLVMGGPSANPRVLVDLEGDTKVTVRQTSQRYETYDLHLLIRGDLLNPDGVNISGTSDPPDLSQEEIQAIVGQRQFIETIAGTALGDTGFSALQDSLISLAIPSLTSEFTGELARALSLDYLVLDYNPFEGAIFRAGKSLLKGLTIDFERQLFPPEFGSQKFEIQLSYRLPVKNDILSRTRFTFGMDESVPWKIGVNYSIKF